MTDWVSVPKEPTREMLSALAGHPALLAASVEESAREAYKALLSAAPAATEWRPMVDAPKDCKFLAFTVQGDIEIGEWYEIKSHRWEQIDDSDLFRRVPVEPATGWNCNSFDYWMPLPPLPGKEE